MTTISLTDGRYINAAHVVQFTKLRNGETRFLLSTGGDLTGETYFDPVELFFPIIPANPGFFAVFVDHLPNGSFLYKLKSVIGWKVTKSGNWPIFDGMSRDEDEDFAVIVDPSGAVFDSDGNQHELLASWKAEYEAEYDAVQEAA